MTFIGMGKVDIFFRLKMIILRVPYIVMVIYHIHFARESYNDEHRYEKT